MQKQQFTLLLFLFLGSLCWSQPCGCPVNIKKEKSAFNNALDQRNFDRATQLASQLIHHPKPSCKIIGNDFMVTIFNYQQNLDSIKYYLDQEAKLLPKIPCDTTAKMEYYASLSDYYMHAEELENGVSAALKALYLAEKTKNIRLQAFLLSNLSVCFNRLGQLTNEFHYAQLLEKKLPFLEDPIARIDYANSIASSYINYLAKHPSRTLNETVKKRISSNLLFAEKQNYPDAKVYGYNLFARFYETENKLNWALKYIDSALVENQSKRITNQVYNYYQIYTEQSRLFSLIQAPNKALISAEKAHSFAIQSEYNQSILISKKRLAECLNATGNHKKAALLYEEYVSLKEKQDEEERTSTVNRLELKFNKAKNEQIIVQQQQRNLLLSQEAKIQTLRAQRLFVIIFIILLVGIITAIQIRQRHLKQRHLLLETELRLNRSRINPHFFFNILTGIQSAILRETDKKETIIQLSKFARIMRQSLESTYEENGRLEDEILFLSEYLELQKFRKQQSVEYAIHITDELKYSDIKIPSMLVQPFVENAIEHGVMNSTENGKIDISFTATNKELEISVMDNGKGEHAVKVDKQHISRATQITTERLHLLNKQYKANARLFIEQKSNGFHVRLILPLNLT